MHPIQLSPRTSPDNSLSQRLETQGPASLSDAELLAVLIGGPESRSVPAMRELLRSMQNDLWRISRCGHMELINNHGLTRRQCSIVQAALHLAHRRADRSPTERPLILASTTAYDLLREVLTDLPHEEFWLLLLDRGNRLIARVRTSTGGLTGTVADPKFIFKQALDHRACGLVLAHNHPSGQLHPSQEDIALTKRLCEAGRSLDLHVQDHIIVGLTGYYSFQDNGMMP